MADFNDVVKQLKDNNEAEKSRDSNLNKNIANLRQSNKESFKDFVTAQQQNTKTNQELVDSQSSNKAAEVEIDKDANAKNEKQLSLLEVLGEKLGDIGKSMKAGFTKYTGGAGGFGKFIRGTLLAGLFIAIAAFLQSKYFGDAVDLLTNTIMPALENFFENTLKPFGRAVAALVKGDFAGAFTEIMKVENPLGLAAGFIGLATLLAPGKMFKVLKGAVKLFGKALNLVGIKLPGFAPKLPGASKGGLPGVPTKAKGIVKTAGNFAKMGKSAGKGIGGFIGGILQGVAIGLKAIAAPMTLLGLAAVVLAINGIAFAIRVMSPAFVPLGKMMKSFGKAVREVFGGLGDFIKDIGKTIEGIINSLGKSIGDVVDKISSMSTAGTEATTKQIKELSAIPAKGMFEAAKGIDAMKAALNDFGGGTFSNVAKSLFGGGGPIEKIVELTKKVPALMKAAEAISVISAAGGDYAMAQQEIKRRAKVAELESRLAGDKFDAYTDKGKAEEKASMEAELKVLKSQKMELQLSGKRAKGGPMGAGGMYLVGENGPELVMPKSAGMVQSEQKTNDILKSALGKSSGGQTTIVNNAPNVKTSTNNSNTTVSSTQYVGQTDPIFNAAAFSGI